jgi:two-component system, OmpR family, sensor histidine kinase SenX3
MSHDEISFTDLMASSIHDMKNSVNVQVNALEQIAHEAKARGDLDAFNSLVVVIAQSHRVNANLIQLLSLYKFGKSTYPLDIRELSVAELIEEAVLQIRSVLDFKDIRLTVLCPPKLDWYFDRDLMTGVLLNALNNACNYTRDSICVVASVADGLLTLRLEDNGPGYPAQMLSHDGVAANKGVNFFNGSTGLGFYFSAQVAHLHQNRGRHGALSIENGGTYGGGCFVVTLP